MEKKYKILLTGSAGFIGHHVTLALQKGGYTLFCLDSINSYYDTELKYDRLKLQGFYKKDIYYSTIIQSKNHATSYFLQLDLTDEKQLQNLFREQQFDIVVNLAAQAGVRYSLEQPMSYIDSNIVGFVNLLECCRKYTVKHFLFASSSSVYGLDQETPFRTDHCTDYPVSLYAATKKANEVIAYSYAHLYQIPTTGLRFFTVYGPWGRPDMAYYSFAKNIWEGIPIKVFNNGDMSRDFTYIDDVVNCIHKLLPLLPQKSASKAAYQLFNIGNNKPEHLLDMIAILERLLNKKAVIDLLPMQAGDVYTTYADVEDLQKKIDYKPTTSLEEGLGRFVTWYLQHHTLVEVPVATHQINQL